MMKAGLIYPHQLFDDHPVMQQKCHKYFVIEEPLLFNQFAFHRQKLILHRASMKHYAQQLKSLGSTVRYVESCELKQSADILTLLRSEKIKSVCYVDLSDDWLSQRVSRALDQANIATQVLSDPHFLTDLGSFGDYASGKKKWHFTDFYMSQRKRLSILLDEDGRPEGGKWSFDTENRKKLPKGLQIPSIRWPKSHATVDEARSYVLKEFPDSPGSDSLFRYPVNHLEAKRMLDDFLDNRFNDFGAYEDSIAANETFLFHSVLTPALNIGLISPQQIIDAVLLRRGKVPMNSLEGFIRQVIGWREYMRGVYHFLGRKQRCSNYWNHQRKIPAEFYAGTTGIEPIDTVIRRVLQHGYCHHIERLMVLGNFMLLCEIHPDEIYRWFMELFVDAYDWVMVPNVYGMSQHADGGLITTKPYISGSAYILKMSDFKKGPWCAVWDALYWRFIDRHRDFFCKNPRMSVMVSQCNRLGPKLTEHHRVAEKFLERLG
jgi:deoxyribodipyrimidine photolyase-related protein